MRFRASTLLLLALFVSFAPLSALADMKGSLERTDDRDLQQVPYATRYRILIELGEERLSQAEIQNPQTFVVESTQAGKSLLFQVDRATWAGFSEERDGVDVWQNVYLWGPFRADGSYAVTVRLPAGSEGQARQERVEVAAIEGAEKSGLLRIATDHLAFEAKPAMGDNTDGLGFVYDLKASLYRRVRVPDPQDAPRVLEVKVGTEGEFSTASADSDFQSSLKGGGSIDYRYHLRRTLDIGAGGESDRRLYSYPIGLRLKPAEFEADRQFRDVDYTLKTQLVAAIPYSDLPVLLWMKQTGLNRPFLPLTVLLGHTYAHKIEDKDRTKTLSNRLEGEILYKVPVAEKIDFQVRWQPFTDFDEFEDNLVLGGTYYFDAKHKAGVELSYQRGALPPDFADTDSIRLGLSLDFF